MANKPYNVEGWSYSLNLNDSNIKNVNADANYGPWTAIGNATDSVDSGTYMGWLASKGVSTPKEGTLIAVQPTEHADVTLYVYTSNVGDGTWKPVGSGSGGTGTDDIGYVTDNVEVQLLNKQVVSTSANQNLTLEQQAHARANINAADVDKVYLKTDVYTKSEISDLLDDIENAGSSPGDSYYTKTEANSNFVRTGSVDQTINGQKTFDGTVIFNNAPNPVQFNYDATIKGTLKYTKPNASKSSVESGFLVRNTSGVVSSQAITALDIEYNNEEGPTASLLTAGNSVDHCLSTLDEAIYNLSQAQSQSGNAGTLNTNNNSTQNVQATESLSGTVNLHRISKTGSYSDLLNKPITVSGTNDENASIAKNLIIGTEQSNKDLTVNGDATITGDLTIGTGSSITTPSAGISSAQIGLLSLGNLTANSILKLDSQKHVISDTGTFMKFGGELNNYDELPGSSVEIGDTRYIRDKDEFVVASSVTNDNNLYIRVPGVNLITLNVEGTDPTHPIVSYSDLKSNLAYVHTTYSDYPLIDYYYHSLPAGGDGRLRVIPVNGGDYGTIVVLASTQKIFVVTTQDDGGPVNSWYCTGLDNTGEVKDITTSLPEDDITIRTFTVFGGGVVWTGTDKANNQDNPLIFGCPDHNGGAPIITYNAIEYILQNNSSDIHKILLKYSNSEYATGHTIYMRCTGINISGNYVFSATQYDYNETKAFTYCAELTDTDNVRLYTIEHAGTAGIPTNQ